MNKNDPIDIKILSISKIPHHYKKWRPNPKENPDIESALVYMMIDPETFWERNIVIQPKHLPESSKGWSTIDNKKYIHAVKEKSHKEGRAVLNLPEYHKISPMSKTARETIPSFQNIFKKGEIRKSYVVWYNTKTFTFLESAPKKLKTQYVAVKFTVEYIRTEKKTGFIVLSYLDKSIDPESLMYGFERKGLDVQAAFALDAISSIKSLVNLSVLILAIEKENGVSAVLTEWDYDSIDIGREIYKKRLKTISECMKKNNYFGYSGFAKDKSGIVKISLPYKSVKKVDNNLFW